MSHQRPRALVIGGSVGGLFAANLLDAAGWDVDVFERATGDLGDRGTGIGTRDELFAVMRRIGLAADASLGVDVLGRVALDRDGRILQERPVPAVTSAWQRIWRPLRRALPDARYHGGRALTAVEPRSTCVVAAFADGARAEGDLLVGADGLHSTVRAQLLPSLAPQYAGYVAWRGVVEAEAIASADRELMLHRMIFGFPDGELMLSLPMPGPESAAPGARRCHFVWFRPVPQAGLADLCTDRSGKRHGVSIPPPLIRPELIAAVKADGDRRLAPQLAALLHATAQIILQPIFDLEAPRITFDRVALIGDAAFVARPHVATGVMKAAIDAETLADAVAAAPHDLSAAMERYERERQPFGAWLVARGRHIGRTFEAGDLAPHQRVDMLMREYGAAGMVRDQPIAARLSGA